MWALTVPQICHPTPLSDHLCTQPHVLHILLSTTMDAKGERLVYPSLSCPFFLLPYSFPIFKSQSSASSLISEWASILGQHPGQDLCLYCLIIKCKMNPCTAAVRSFWGGQERKAKKDPRMQEGLPASPAAGGNSP